MEFHYCNQFAVIAQKITFAKRTQDHSKAYLCMCSKEIVNLGHFFVQIYVLLAT